MAASRRNGWEEADIHMHLLCCPELLHNLRVSDEHLLAKSVQITAPMLILPNEGCEVSSHQSRESFR